MLIAAGAEVTARDKHGNSLLHRAAEDFAPNLLEAPDDRTELVKALVGAGADPNARGNWGRTPLFAAAEHPDQRARTMKALVAAGGDPNVYDEFGFMPIHEAAGCS